MEGNTLTAKCKESNPPQESQDFEVSILSLSDQNINLFLINLHKISKVKIVCRNYFPLKLRNVVFPKAQHDVLTCPHSQFVFS